MEENFDFISKTTFIAIRRHYLDSYEPEIIRDTKGVLSAMIEISKHANLAFAWKHKFVVNNLENYEEITTDDPIHLIPMKMAICLLLLETILVEPTPVSKILLTSLLIKIGKSPDYDINYIITILKEIWKMTPLPTPSF